MLCCVKPCFQNVATTSLQYKKCVGDAVCFYCNLTFPTGGAEGQALATTNRGILYGCISPLLGLGLRKFQKKQRVNPKYQCFYLDCVFVCMWMWKRNVGLPEGNSIELNAAFLSVLAYQQPVTPSTFPIVTVSGRNSVTIGTPSLSGGDVSSFTSWEIQWRPVGGEWQTATIPTSSSTYTIPGELAGGVYDIRVRATSASSNSLYTWPVQVSLPTLPTVRKCLTIRSMTLCPPNTRLRVSENSHLRLKILIKIIWAASCEKGPNAFFFKNNPSG